MWKTPDGYTVSLPRFRVRRLTRRLGQRTSDPTLRMAARTLRLLFGRARPSRETLRLGRRSHPRLVAPFGAGRIEIVTRALGPGRLEVLYMRRLLS